MRSENLLQFLHSVSYGITWFFACLAATQMMAAPIGPPPPESRTPPNLYPVEVAQSMPEREPVEAPEQIKEFYFVDNSVDQVLELLGRLTGRKLLLTENLPSPRLNFDSRGSMKKEDAIVALESLLSMNGVAVTELGSEFLRVYPSNNIRFKSPEVLRESTLTMKPSEKVYSKLFKLRFIAPESINSTLTNLVTQGTGYIELIDHERAFLVVDTLSNIQRIESFISELDQPGDDEIIVKELAYIEASELKQKLDESLAGSLADFVEGSVSVTADERSNKIIIVTHPYNVAILEKMVTLFDVDTTPFTKSEVFYIKHANAADLVAILKQLIDGQKQAKDSAKGSNQKTALVLKESGQEEHLSRELHFSDYLELVADERSNAIIVCGTTVDIESVGELIDDMDVLLAQVKIDVVIAEVTLTNECSRGIEKFGISYDENDEIHFNVNEDSDLGLSFKGSLSDFLFKGMTVSEFTLSTIFNTAKKDTDISVLSSPTLITTHNREAIINAGESRPVITSTNTDSTGVNIRSQVQFKDIGIYLKVKPLIGANGMVQMEISQTVESVVDEVLIDGNSQPVIGKREASSFVSVADGQMIVLGGLQEKTLREVGGRMALLGEIPVLGKWLFSSKRNREIDRELLIFIQPTVFRGTLDMPDKSRKDSEEKKDLIKQFSQKKMRRDS